MLSTAVGEINEPSQAMGNIRRALLNPYLGKVQEEAGFCSVFCFSTVSDFPANRARDGSLQRFSWNFLLKMNGVLLRRR